MSDLTERTFRGTLTGRDVKRHIPHVFQVPEGAARVRATLSFDPAIVAGHRNMICLTLFDPAGFRGAGHRHGNRHVVEISRDAATPAFRWGIRRVRRGKLDLAEPETLAQGCTSSHHFAQPAANGQLTCHSDHHEPEARRAARDQTRPRHAPIAALPPP